MIRSTRLITSPGAKTHIRYRHFSILRYPCPVRLLILALVLAVPVFTARAELVWEKTEQSFKTVPGQVTVKAAYPFKNSGADPVTITGLKTSCGCTTATPSKLTYAPGESGTIDAVFSIGTRTGLQKKTIRIETSDHRSQELRLTVSIPELLHIEPTFVLWTAGEPATEKIVTLTVKADPPFKITGLKGVPDKIKASLEPLPDGLGYRLHLQPKDATSPTDGWIELETDLPADKGIRFRVYVGVKPKDPTL